jgi:N6-L-threonylcarbamoyladenine synthase
MEAVAASGRGTLAVVGGVARNRALRADLERRCAGEGVRLVCAPPDLCSDNAAMIASAARFLPRLAPADYLGLDAYASFAAAA